MVTLIPSNVLSATIPSPLITFPRQQAPLFTIPSRPFTKPCRSTKSTKPARIPPRIPMSPRGCLSLAARHRGQSPSLSLRSTTIGLPRNFFSPSHVPSAGTGSPTTTPRLRRAKEGASHGRSTNRLGSRNHESRHSPRRDVHLLPRAPAAHRRTSGGHRSRGQRAHGARTLAGRAFPPRRCPARRGRAGLHHHLRRDRPNRTRARNLGRRGLRHNPASRRHRLFP